MPCRRIQAEQELQKATSLLQGRLDLTRSAGPGFRLAPPGPEADDDPMTCVHVPSRRSRQFTFSWPRLLLGFLLPISPILAPAETLPLHDNGAVAVWTVAGPFPNDPARAGLNTDFLKPSGGESQASPAEGDMIKRPPDMTTVWQTAFGTGSGELDFTDLFRNAHRGHSVAYAFCQLESVESQRVLLLIRHRRLVRSGLMGN